MTLPSTIKRLSLLLLTLVLNQSIFGQTPYPGCPNVAGQPSDGNLHLSNDTVYLNCNQTCVDLEANFLQTGLTNQYRVESIPFAPPFPFTGGTALFVNQDDVFSGVINLPFDFCFYGGTYNSLVVGANGLISFDVSLAGAFCEYSYSNPIPSPQAGGLFGTNGPYELSIHGAYHDMDPTKGNPDINYSVLGSPPCRTFVINWTDVPQFSCNNLITTQQIVLYENTNAIEVYIKNKDICGSWVSGVGVIGIQNAAGSQGIAPPGRNSSAWSAQNEGWRFTPDGAPNYTVKWYDMARNNVGTGANINHCPPNPSNPDPIEIEVEYTNCNGVKTIVKDTIIVQAKPELTIDYKTVDALCFDSCTGQGIVEVLTGDGPFVFDWDNGASNDTVNGLCAGNYSVDVYDRYGCMESVSFTIGEPTEITSTTQFTDALCFQSTDGTGEVDATGGSNNFTYLWSDGTTLDNITGGKGQYTVIITDDNGCLGFDTLDIDHPTQVTIDTVYTKDLSCATNMDGEIEVIGAGGTTPYKYSVDLGAFGGSAVFTGLSEGVHTLTVQDKNGCEAFNTYTLFSDSVRVEGSPDVKVCENTPVTLTASGYYSTHAWSDGVTDGVPFTPSHLGDKEYEVIAYNANNCEDRDTVIVTVERIPDPTITPAGPYCLNSPPETLTSAEFGGVWSGPGIDPSGYFDPAAAGQGVHEIIYKIPGFCPVADTIQVAVNSIFDAAINPIPDPCELSNPITLTSATPGGYWYGPGIADTLFSDFSPQLAGPGTHKVYHLIDNTCGDYDSLLITVRPADVGAIDPIPNFCVGAASHQATASPAGGTWEAQPYLTNTGVFHPSVGGTGSYQVIYTPAGDCAIKDTIIVTVVDTITAQRDSTHLDCFGASDGTLTTNYNGGTGSGYTFSWTPNVSTSATANNLPAGTYDVTVADDLGCFVTVQHEVTEPSGMSFTQTPTTTNALCKDSCNGTAQFFVTGGTVPTNGYDFQLQHNTSGATLNNNTGIFNGLCQGNYTMTVTDGQGCSLTDQVSITEPTYVNATYTINPAFCNQPNGSVIINTTSGGTAPYQYTWDGTLEPDTHKLNAIPNTYNLLVTDANGCIFTDQPVVPNTGSPSVTADFETVTCFNGSDGQAFAQGSGGTPPYAFTWDNGMSGDTITGLPIGTYTVTITDSQGCFDTDQTTVTEPTQVIATPVADSTLCIGQTFQTMLNAQGGNGAPYTFEINGVAIPANTYSTDQPGTYTVMAYDTKGCNSPLISFNVIYRDTVKVVASPPAEVCPGDQTTFNAAATGGLGTFNYTWSNGMTGSTITITTNTSGIPDTLYVTANDGCSIGATAKTYVDFFPIPNLQASLTPPNGCEPVIVDFQLSDQNFQSINWDLGDGNTVHDQLSFTHIYPNAGDYPIAIDVISEDGCYSSTTLAPVNVYAVPFGDISQQPKVITDVEGNAMFFVQGSDNISSVNWDLMKYPNLQDTIHQENIIALQYTFGPDTGRFKLMAEFITQYGCKDTTYHSFDVIPQEVIYVPNTFTPNGDDANDFFSIKWLNIRPSIFSIQIFDRWGEKVYESSNPDFEWDGRYLSEIVSSGVYSWKIDYYSERTRKQAIFGTVTVLK